MKRKKNNNTLFVLLLLVLCTVPSLIIMNSLYHLDYYEFPLPTSLFWLREDKRIRKIKWSKIVFISKIVQYNFTTKKKKRETGKND